MQNESSPNSDSKNFSWFGWCTFLIIGVLIGRELSPKTSETSVRIDEPQKPAITQEDLEAFQHWKNDQKLHEQLKDELKKIQEKISEQKVFAIELENTNNSVREDLENVRNEIKTSQDEIAMLAQNREEVMKEVENLSLSIAQLNREMSEMEQERQSLENLETENSN